MKRPKKLWIGFNPDTKRACYRVYEHDPHLDYAQPYHLHPGNEVARALNILYKQRGCFHPQCMYPEIINRLSSAGIRVRWDAKTGRFL